MPQELQQLCSSAPGALRSHLLAVLSSSLAAYSPGYPPHQAWAPDGVPTPPLPWQALGALLERCLAAAGPAYGPGSPGRGASPAHVRGGGMGGGASGEDVQYVQAMVGSALPQHHAGVTDQVGGWPAWGFGWVGGWVIGGRGPGTAMRRFCGTAGSLRGEGVAWLIIGGSTELLSWLNRVAELEPNAMLW